MEKIPFRGTIAAVKARIRLIRSFDQTPSHQYLGYTLVLKCDDQQDQLRVAVGPKAHEKEQFRIGDEVQGLGEAIADPEREWADLYKVSQLVVLKRGSETEIRSPDPDGGIAPALDIYKKNGHFRLEKGTCTTACASCPWGLTMPTEIKLDHWDLSRTKWRFETHCYGPRGCPRYKAGPPYKVQGRKPGMIYVDNDVERFESGE